MTVRSGMTDIISELRILTSAGTADYSIGTTTFWSDQQLQNVLDRHAWKMDAQQMTPSGAYSDGGYAYYDYYIGRGWLEQSTGGTAIFYVMDVDGTQIASADYSVDYNIGQVTFDDDTGGEIRLATCTSYDMNAAASEVWRSKASYYHSAVNFSTDNHNISREQIYKHCMEQALHFESLSHEANESIDLSRSDDLLGSFYGLSIDE
jgi:hypothetical protein